VRSIFNFSKKHSQSAGSIFNSSKIILKAWEAFSITRKSILKTREAFSNLKESIRKTPAKGEIILNFQTKHFNSGVRHSEFSQKSFLSWTRKRRARKKGIITIPWRHSENAHRFGQHRHDFLSKASRVQLEKFKHKNFFWMQARIMIYMFRRKMNWEINSFKN
jgi:hypothetical protein